MQTVMTKIRLLEQSDLGMHCLSERLQNISAVDKSIRLFCDMRFWYSGSGVVLDCIDS